MFFLSLLYLALTIIRPQDYLPSLVGVPLLSGVLVLAFAGWLLSGRKTFAAPQFLLVPAFFLIAMLSQVANGWVGGALDDFVKFGPTVIIFLVLAANCTTQRRVVVTMAVFVLCSAVLAVHGVEQANTGIGWTGVALGGGHRIQYVGIFNDPNDLALLFVTTIPMAFFLSRRGGLLGRLFWLSTAALLLYGVYLTNSRGAFLAVLVVGGVYVWHHRGMVTAGVLGVIGLTVMKLLSSRMQDLDPDEESAFGRVDAWYEGLEMFRSNPLFGVGPGNFTDYNYLTAHNSFVLVLAETGFLGFTLWLAFVCYGFMMMRAVLRYAPEGPVDEATARSLASECATAFTLLLSLCGFFAAAFFLSRSYTVVLYLQAAVVVGYYVGARRRFPGLPTFRLSGSSWRWIPIAISSIVFMHVVVAVLLRSS